MSATGGAITLRQAAADEIEALAALAFRSKAHWGYDPAFMDACRDELGVTPAQIVAGRVVVAQIDAQTAGFAAIEPLGELRYDLTHLFVDPDWLRRGVEPRLLAAVCEQIAKAGGAVLEVQSDPNAAGFYRAEGGQPAGCDESLSIPGRMLPCFEFAVSRARERVRAPTHAGEK